MSIRKEDTLKICDPDIYHKKEKKDDKLVQRKLSSEIEIIASINKLERKYNSSNNDNDNKQ